MHSQLIPRAERFETCIGMVERSFVTAPNTKYNPDGVFKIRLHCDLADPAVQTFKAKVDAAAQAAFVAKVPETQRDAWEPFLPYEVAEDGGSICFRFYRGAKVTAVRKAGVRFEFSAVKVLRLAQPTSPFSEDAAGDHAP